MTTIIPLEQRPELSALLAKLRKLDPNGWCIATDGSCDDMTTDEAIASLQTAIDTISSDANFFKA